MPDKARRRQAGTIVTVLLLQVLSAVPMSIKQELIVYLNYGYVEFCHYSVREVITVFSPVHFHQRDFFSRK